MLFDLAVQQVRSHYVHINYVNILGTFWLTGFVDIKQEILMIMFIKVARLASCFTFSFGLVGTFSVIKDTVLRCLFWILNVLLLHNFILHLGKVGFLLLLSALESVNTIYCLCIFIFNPHLFGSIDYVVFLVNEKGNQFGPYFIANLAIGSFSLLFLCLNHHRVGDIWFILCIFH